MGSNASNGKLGEVEKGRGGPAKGMRQRTHAKKIYDIVARRVAGMSPEEGAATLRPSPKRYKANARTGAKAPREYSSGGQAKCAGSAPHTGFT